MLFAPELQWISSLSNMSSEIPNFIAGQLFDRSQDALRGDAIVSSGYTQASRVPEAGYICMGSVNCADETKELIKAYLNPYSAFFMSSKSWRLEYMRCVALWK